MNAHDNVNPVAIPMQTILTLVRAGRKIEAIKEFRAGYGGGLREAKDAIEAIADIVMPLGIGPIEYIVLGRYEDGDDYQVIRADSRDEAMHHANSIVDLHAEVAVAGIVARSITVTVRSMKELA